MNADLVPTLNADLRLQPSETHFMLATAMTHRYFTTIIGEAPIEVVLDDLGPGGRLVSEQRLPGSGGVHRFLEGERWVAEVRAIRPPEVLVRLAVRAPEDLDAVTNHFEQSFPKPEPERNTVSVMFTYDTDHGSRSRTQRIGTQPWNDVAHNYPAAARSEVAQLMSLDRPTGLGRLLLLHGPPGTGKSHLLRTLAWEWSDWADTVVVTDPEAMVAKSAYLYEVLDRHPGDDRWMLLVIEDAAELLGETATSRMHPGLAKMLNVSDGMLGEAFGLLIAITTNESLHRIHPAITRPGRCLANVHLDGFDRREARDRLGPDTALPAGERITLGQIFEIERNRSRITVNEHEPTHVGEYL